MGNSLYYILGAYYKWEFSAPLNISACRGSWVSKSLTAGSLAQFQVEQMDSFGNKVILTGASQKLISWAANVTTVQLSKVVGNLGPSGVDVAIVATTAGVVNINFNMTRAGEYYLHVAAAGQSGGLISLSNSPFYFKVNPGSILSAACNFTWFGNNSYTAGDRALGIVSLMDSFNNSVTTNQSATGTLGIQVLQLLALGATNFLDVKTTQVITSSTVAVSFATTLSGSFQLLITDNYGFSIKGSPFSFSVVPGHVVIKNCVGQWQNGSSQVEEGSLAQFVVLECDAFGNVVCRNASQGEKQLVFVAKVTGLEEVEVLDLEFTPLQGKGNGTVCGQGLTFIVSYNLGRFRLEIKSSNQSILGSPFPFTVVEGPVSSNLSTFEGPGLESSTAGVPTYYDMTLRDHKGDPKGSHVNSLSVQIFIFGGSVQITPTIVAVPNNLGVFNVSYLPAVSGVYVILTRWIGVQLGETRYMTVHPGPISISNCTGRWESDVVNVQVGQIARFIITQCDAYGNEVFSDNTSDAAPFSAQVFKMGTNESVFTSVLSFELLGSRPTKNQLLSFQIWEVGSLSLDIKSKDKRIKESPFPFTCSEGPVALPECSGEWQDGKHSFPAGDTAKFILYCAQDVSITNLSFNPTEFQGSVRYAADNSLVTISDLRIEKMVTESMGSQLLRFSITKSGSLLLYVQNMVRNLTNSPFKFTCTEGPISLEHCTGKWKSGLNQFQVGTHASFVIRQSDAFGNAVYDDYPFTIRVIQRNASVVVTFSDAVIEPFFIGRTEYRLLTFTLKEVGDFSLYVGNSSVDISRSPFNFAYIVGLPAVENTLVVGEGLSPLASVNFWNEIIVYIRDLFGNAVGYLNASSLRLSASGADTVEVEGFKPGLQGGYVAAYKPFLTGEYDIYISYNGLSVPKSPFRINVGPGWIQARFCTAIINPSNTVVAGDKIRVFVTAREVQGHPVPYVMQAVSFTVTPIPLGIASPQSMHAQVYDSAMGLYATSFSIVAAGSYGIEILAYGSPINGSDYTLKVIPGPMSLQHCVINSTNWMNAHAGRMFFIEVLAKDALGNIVDEPSSGIEDQGFVATITGSKTKSFNLSYIADGVYRCNVSYNVSRSYNLNITYTGHVVNQIPLSIFVAASAINPSTCSYAVNIAERVLLGTDGILTIQAKDMYGNSCTSGGEGFKVTLMNPKAMDVSSGIPFDNGNGQYLFPFHLGSAGNYKVNITYKGVRVAGQEQIIVLTGSTEAVMIVSVTPTLVPTENYTTLTMSGENLMQIISFSCHFGDIEKRPGQFNTGEETLQCDTPYVNEAMTVRLAIQLTLFQGKSTFYFEVVFYVDTFPVARGDKVWCWINSFVSFDPLSNDHVAYGAPNLLGICQAPKNGRAEMVGSSIRYFSQPNFTGSDSLTYTISDFGGRIAHGDVSLSVYDTTPQFISLPQVLMGIEDQPIPTKGGIQGLEIANPNIDESLTVEVQAQNGHLKFAEDMAHLWEGVQILSYDTVDNSKQNSTKATLRFEGPFTLLTSAIQALQYQGEAFFNGNDFIKLQIYNKRLEGSSKDILVMLQAKNDPPFINASSNIYLNASYWKTIEDIPIAISIGDPDQKDTQGTSRVLQLQLSLEVDSRSLQMSVSSSAVPTLILKGEGSRVLNVPNVHSSLGDNVTVVGRAMEFQDTIKACNRALGSLRLLRGSPKGLKTILLTITVNDLGNFGCYEGCFSNASVALQSTALMVLNFEYVPPDVRAKVAISLTCCLLFLMYMTILIVRYRRSLAYRFDDGTLSEEDMLKKTRVFNPVWAKHAEGEASFDFGIANGALDKGNDGFDFGASRRMILASSEEDSGDVLYPPAIMFEGDFYNAQLEARSALIGESKFEGEKDLDLNPGWEKARKNIFLLD